MESFTVTVRGKYYALDELKLIDVLDKNNNNNYLVLQIVEKNNSLDVGKIYTALDFVEMYGFGHLLKVLTIDHVVFKPD